MSNERYNAVLIDDDRRLLEGLRSALRAEPYDVHTVNDPRQASDVFAEVRPEVIVCDYQMPGLSGIEVLSHARAVLPDSCRILMTGSPSLTMAVETINQGAITRLFLKPFRIQDLAAAVREAMERAETNRLTHRLLLQARQDQRLLDRVKQLAPHIMSKMPGNRLSESGAIPAEDYLPHDSHGILQALRLHVRPAGS